MMKKIFLATILAIILLPSLAFIIPPRMFLTSKGDIEAGNWVRAATLAQEDAVPAPPEGIVPTGSDRTIENPLGNSTPQNVIDNILIVVFGAAGLVAVAYLIIGGYQFITSQGNPDLATQAKGTITNSIIGLIIVLTAYIIVRFALQQLGAEGILG
jgi:hypothetical protein